MPSSPHSRERDRHRTREGQLSSSHHHTSSRARSPPRTAAAPSKLVTWGQGEYGRLGHGDWQVCPEPKVVEFFHDRNILHVACGKNSSAAVDDFGEVFTWGWGALGVLGHGDERSQRLPKRIGVLNGRGTCGISVGNLHMIARNARGEVYTWGSGVGGTLGLGSEECHSKPMLVSDLSAYNIVDVAAGAEHCAAVSDGGEVFVWGEGAHGRLGLGSDYPSLVPRLLEKLSGRRIVKVECGDHFTLALTDIGDVFTWGSSVNYQCGIGTSGEEWFPVQVQGIRGRVVGASCGSRHVLVVTDTGDVYTWGEGSHGKLGLGDDEDQRLPQLVTTLSGKRVVKVSAGEDHSAAITDTGDIYTWGHYMNGRLGHGTHAGHDEYIPRLVAAGAMGGSTVDAACGGEATMALVVKGNRLPPHRPMRPTGPSLSPPPQRQPRSQPMNAVLEAAGAAAGLATRPSSRSASRSVAPPRTSPQREYLQQPAETEPFFLSQQEQSPASMPSAILPQTPVSGPSVVDRVYSEDLHVPEVFAIRSEFKAHWESKLQELESLKSAVNHWVEDVEGMKKSYDARLEDALSLYSNRQDLPDIVDSVSKEIAGQIGGSVGGLASQIRAADVVLGELEGNLSETPLRGAQRLASKRLLDEEKGSLVTRNKNLETRVTNLTDQVNSIDEERQRLEHLWNSTRHNYLARMTKDSDKRIEARYFADWKRSIQFRLHQQVGDLAQQVEREAHGQHHLSRTVEIQESDLESYKLKFLWNVVLHREKVTKAKVFGHWKGEILQLSKERLSLQTAESRSFLEKIRSLEVDNENIEWKEKFFKEKLSDCFLVLNDAKLVIRLFSAWQSYVTGEYREKMNKITSRQNESLAAVTETLEEKVRLKARVKRAFVLKSLRAKEDKLLHFVIRAWRDLTYSEKISKRDERFANLHSYTERLQVQKQKTTRKLVKRILMRLAHQDLNRAINTWRKTIIMNEVFHAIKQRELLEKEMMTEYDRMQQTLSQEILHTRESYTRKLEEVQGRYQNEMVVRAGIQDHAKHLAETSHDLKQRLLHRVIMQIGNRRILAAWNTLRLHAKIEERKELHNRLVSSRRQTETVHNMREVERIKRMRYMFDKLSNIHVAQAYRTWRAFMQDDKLYQIHVAKDHLNLIIGGLQQNTTNQLRSAGAKMMRTALLAWKNRMLGQGWRKWKDVRDMLIRRDDRLAHNNKLRAVILRFMGLLSKKTNMKWALHFWRDWKDVQAQPGLRLKQMRLERQIAKMKVVVADKVGFKSKMRRANFFFKLWQSVTIDIKKLKHRHLRQKIGADWRGLRNMMEQSLQWEPVDEIVSGQQKRRLRIKLLRVVIGHINWRVLSSACRRFTENALRLKIVGLNHHIENIELKTREIHRAASMEEARRVQYKVANRVMTDNLDEVRYHMIRLALLFCIQVRSTMVQNLFRVWQTHTAQFVLPPHLRKQQQQQQHKPRDSKPRLSRLEGLLYHNR